MKKIPFYGNLPDDLHCAVAVYKALVEYYFDEIMSWAEAEEFQGFNDGCPGWNIVPQTKLASRGIEVRCIEPFDYKKYIKLGDAYLPEICEPEAVKWFVEQTLIHDMVPYIDEFEQKVDHQLRNATIKDVESMLSDGFLIGTEINAHLLNDQEGFNSHYILIHGFKDDNFIINDPGLPPQQNRKVPYQKMRQVIELTDHPNEVTGFRKS